MTDHQTQSASETGEEEVVSALGDAFLGFLCNASVDEIALARTGTRLDVRRQTVYNSAVGIAQQFAARRRPNASNDDSVPPPSQRFEPLRSSFGRFFAVTGGDTVANELRRAAGGSIRPLPDRDDDQLRFGLHWLVRDLWPGLLLPADEDDSMPRLWDIGLPASSHPSDEVILGSLEVVREPVRQLFRDALGPYDSVVIESTTGRAGSLQPVTLGREMMSAAARRCGKRPGENGDLFFDALDAVLDDLRRLARGRVAEVPALVGLTGLRLPDQRSVTTALGTMRSAGTGEFIIAPDLPAPDLVFELTFPTKYSVLGRLQSDAAAMPGTPNGFWEAWRELDARIDKLRLAVLLARGHASGEFLRVISHTIHEPLFLHMRGRPVNNPYALELQADADAGIVVWADRIARHYRQEIALGVRRLLSAVDPLRDTEDGLVDAVIALEALFGTGQSEVGFRLQTALAFLLARDDAERRAIYDEVGDLYDVRSRLVHGTGFPDLDRLSQLRQRAAELGVSSVRRLFSAYPELIANPGRGKAIILAAGRYAPRDSDE